jgi:hypothetical protein
VRASVSTKPLYSLATRSDDAGIRRLLRENPMPGQIAFSLEREPDYFADGDLAGEEKQTIVACESKRVVCVGSCAIRQRFINGQARRVGYLGGLRLDASVAGRFDILRGGYDFFHELQTSARADFYFTSIAAENRRAQRFLERGLPGMPAYEFIGEFVTLLLPAEHRSLTGRDEKSCGKRAGSETGAPETSELIGHLREHGRRRQFSPRWSAPDLSALAPLGLAAEAFRTVRENGRLIATAALWDQRSFKQTVIRGYAPWLARLRLALNVAAGIAGRPRLPSVGARLNHAFASHVAFPPHRPDALAALIQSLRTDAAARKLAWLTLGFAANEPGLAVVRAKFRCREYRSRIYVVRWPDLGGSARELDGRVLAPEVALM